MSGGCKECFKCKSKATFNYKNGLNICKECFQSHVMLRKVRSFLRNELQTFGKHNAFHLYFDGSVDSVVLAHILGQSRAQNSALKKKIFFDFSLIVPQRSWRKEEDAEILRKARLLGEGLVTPIVAFDVIEDEEEAAGWLLLSERAAEKGGFRKDFFDILLSRALLRLGKGKKVLLADCAEQAAAAALALFCTCRQGFVLQRCAPVWRRADGVQARPLLECSRREIAYYAHVNRLFGYTTQREELPPQLSQLPGQGSIQRLLLDFVAELTAANQSTAAAVLRVVEKLAPGEEELGDGPAVSLERVLDGLAGRAERDSPHCLFCQAVFHCADALFCKGCKVMFGLAAD